ncbi:hypothetical protein RFI_30355, partial [Reticulomyxa filosa]
MQKLTQVSSCYRRNNIAAWSISIHKITQGDTVKKNNKFCKILANKQNLKKVASKKGCGYGTSDRDNKKKRDTKTEEDNKKKKEIKTEDDDGTDKIQDTASWDVGTFTLLFFFFYVYICIYRMDYKPFSFFLKKKKKKKGIDPKKWTGRVVTRFPPEPSGCLHIGHAKAVLLNWEVARRFNGKFLLRFDDTNPSKEKSEFEEQILQDLQTLAATPHQVTHTSDYFTELIRICTRLIEQDHAYCDKTPQSQVSFYTLHFQKKKKI